MMDEDDPRRPSYRSLADNLYGAVRYMEQLLDWSRPHRRDVEVAGYGLVHGRGCEASWTIDERYRDCAECRAVLSFVRWMERQARAAGGVDPNEIARIRQQIIDKMPPPDLTAVMDLLQSGHANATAPTEDPPPR